MPQAPLTEEEHAKNNLPDILARWQALEAEADRPRTAQSFMVPREEIAATGSWDLSLNRYKEIEHEEVDHQSSAEIIAELRAWRSRSPRGWIGWRTCWDELARSRIDRGRRDFRSGDEARGTSPLAPNTLVFEHIESGGEMVGKEVDGIRRFGEPFCFAAE